LIDYRTISRAKRSGQTIVKGHAGADPRVIGLCVAHVHRARIAVDFVPGLMEIDRIAANRPTIADADRCPEAMILR
jgi:hypothetical protein